MLDRATSQPRRIRWQSVITVLSAAILIGAEVFGAAFVLVGIVVMGAFIRNAMRIEPFAG